MALISYEDLRAKAIEMLNDGDLFCEMVRELDSYNGFAVGFRCYPMEEIDELFCNVTIGDFLDMLNGDFNHRDNYFTETIYGIGSTDYEEDFYRDNTDNDEVLDALIEYYPHIFFRGYSELEEIVEALDENAEFYEEELGYYTAVDNEE